MKKVIEKYLEYYPDEKESLSGLLELVGRNSGNYRNLFNRKNYEGHITASGFICCPNNNELLLLRHKALNIFLQPGGHIEEKDKDTISGARREVAEETGLKGLKTINISNDINVPFDINSHYIPARKEKQEAGHYHHDFGYLFLIDKPENVELNLNESGCFKWVKIDDLLSDQRHGQAAKKIKAILASK